MHIATRFGAVGALALLALASTLAHAGTVRPSSNTILVPTGKGSADRVAPDAAAPLDAARAAAADAGQIVFHGGPVMTHPSGVGVYLIWYGDWSGNTGTAIVPDFVGALGHSPYWSINTTYTDANGRAVPGGVTLMGQASDAYSQGKRLDDAAIQTIVTGAIASGALPRDKQAVYFVLASKDVNETSGFCTQYCGWHSHAKILNVDVKFAFVGDAARCLASCAPQQVSPNGNAGADAMVSVIAHELEEAVTDPDLDAWYFASGNENADECAWTFGTEYKAANGSHANMKLGARDFLVQQNWVQAARGRCALHP